MAEPKKNAYVLDLSAPQFAAAPDTSDIGSDVVIRPIVAADAEGLAELLLEAYRGTIDYEGEEIDEAREAIAEFLADAPMLGASMIAFVENAAASAVLVMSLDGCPFISYVISHPTHKRTGLARRVVTAACHELVGSGEVEVRFFITDGNVASEALFGTLGAVRLDCDPQ